MKTEKTLIIISVAILLAVGVYFYLVQAKIIGPRIAAGEATLSISPSSGVYDTGSTFAVDILLDTAGQEIDGVDIFYLNYNPAFLEVIDADSSIPGKQITNGDVFDIYVGNSVDEDEGKISISGIVSPGGTPFSGSGTVATINFQALSQRAETDLTFDYVADATTDCNVAEHETGNDILGGVTNGSYIIKSPQGAPDPPSIDIRGNGADGPITIDWGSEVILTLNANNADSCEASGDWSGSKPISGSQSTGQLKISKTYALTCTNESGSAEDSIMVSVTPLDQPPEDGDEPGIIEKIVNAIKAAGTGPILSIGLLIIVIVLAIISLVYLRKQKPPASTPPAGTKN